MESEHEVSTPVSAEELKAEIAVLQEKLAAGEDVSHELEEKEKALANHSE
nr:pedibin precursor [Hydra vulgaris]BAA82554.1 Hym-346/Pedibin [Hydra vulgaris]